MAGKRITDLPATSITPDTRIEVVQDGASRSADLGQIIGRFITITTDYTAVAGDRIGVDASAGPITVRMPASSKSGDCIGFYDPNQTWITNTVTILGVTDDPLICDVSTSFHVCRLGSHWVIGSGIE